VDDFNFFPPDCSLWQMDDVSHDFFLEMFEEQCVGKTECEFQFEKKDLPQDACSNYWTSDIVDWEFMLVASCSDASIEYAGTTVTKGLVGLVVVIFDLIVTFYFWCSLMAMKKF